LRRDFFVGVILSAAGEVECANSIVSSSGNSADLEIVVAIFSGTTTTGGEAVGFGMADEGAFTSKLRRDFFVGVIFSATGSMAGSGNNFAADDLTEEAAVGTSTPEGFLGI